jgi:hypothetical protein
MRPRPQPSRAAVNQRVYRARLRRGEMVYPVALPCEVLEAMLRWRWICREELDDRDRVERAVAAQLADAATHH